MTPPPPRTRWRWQWQWGEGGPALEVPPLTTLAAGPRSRQFTLLASLRFAALWLALLATLWTCRAASGVVLPMVFAVFIALSLNPVVISLSRPYVPRALVAAIVVAIGIVLLASLVAWIAVPARHWFEQAPEALRSLTPKLRGMTRQIEAAGRATQSLIGLGAPSGEHVASQPSTPVLFDVWAALSATPRLLAEIFATVLLAYFFLVFGNDLLRKAVDLSPSLDRKRTTIDIVRLAQREMSRYLFTTTLINSAVGLGAGLIAFALGIPDALFWGALAAVLNFIPYVGPLCMTAIFLLVGLLSFERLGEALLAPGLFAGLVILEGQFITPMILGRRMELNPVVILLWLMVMGWMWGAAGIVLAVPVLAVTRIVCQRVEAWQWLARVIG